MEYILLYNTAVSLNISGNWIIEYEHIVSKKGWKETNTFTERNLLSKVAGKKSLKWKKTGKDLDPL